MKNQPARVVNRSGYVLGCWLLAVTANAQNTRSDSVAVFTGSTIVSVQPVPVLFGTVNLSVEQTLSK